MLMPRPGYLLAAAGLTGTSPTGHLEKSLGKRCIVVAHSDLPDHLPDRSSVFLFYPKRSNAIDG
jgi:hypothetical protein